MSATIHAARICGSSFWLRWRKRQVLQIIDALIERATQETDGTQAARVVAKKGDLMERIVNLHIEKLPEGFYLATSDEVQGLIAQGRKIQETIEIAQDVAKRLIEAQETRHLEHRLPQAAESFDYPMIVNA